MVVEEAARTEGMAGARRDRARAMMHHDILDAALRIVKEDGVKGLTMRALGRAVGVTAPTLYDYFSSKEDVLDALYRQGAERLHEVFAEAVAASEPGLDRWRAILRGYRRFALANPELYLLMFGRVDASYRPGEAETQCALANFEAVVNVVREAIAKGDLRDAN